MCCLRRRVRSFVAPTYVLPKAAEDNKYTFQVDMAASMDPSFVLLRKCKTLKEALTCPRGDRVQIDGKSVVGVFRRGVVVITEQYSEVKLVSLQPDQEGKWWSFSCPIAYASLLPADKERDTFGRWLINDAGYLLFDGPVGTGTPQEVAQAIVSDNPDWFKSTFESHIKQYVQVAMTKPA